MTNCCFHPRLQWRDRCGFSPHSALPTRVVLISFLSQVPVGVKGVQRKIQMSYRNPMKTRVFTPGCFL